MTELRFGETVQKLNMDILMREKGAVIVGFSGGADSSCLLACLAKWGRENGVKVVAAHVNHRIRGDEADSDERFCRTRAEELGVEIFVNSTDVPALARERGVGLEEAARDVRYAFFEEVSEKITGRPDGAVIATAHNSSDNLETVIMNLLRGTGLHGMCGITPVRDGRVIRPLIADSGEDIRKWCAERGISYVIDRTNAENDCTRNIIRNRIVPIMREIASSPEDSVTRMTSTLRQDDEYFAALARETVGEETTVGRDALVSLDVSVAARVLMRMCSNAGGGSSLTEKQIDGILSLAREKSGHSSLSLPSGITAVIERDSVAFTRREREESMDGGGVEYTGGTLEFENGLWRMIFSDRPINMEEFSAENENIYKLSIIRSFDCDKINRSVTVRYKTDGDSYIYGGHTHKVKKMFTDKKLTEREKRLTPLVCDGDGIMWIPGFAVRDGLAKKSGSENECGKRVYVLCLKK